MSKRLIIIASGTTILILSFVLFFILKPTKPDDKISAMNVEGEIFQGSDKILDTNTKEEVTLKGSVYEYSWIKSFDNYDYAHCHTGGYVFNKENSSNMFEYNIQFKDNVNINEYKDKLITIKGDEVIETKEIDMNCDEISQRPAGECEKSETSTFLCKKIINATIIEKVSEIHDKFTASISPKQDILQYSIGDENPTLNIHDDLIIQDTKTGEKKIFDLYKDLSNENIKKYLQNIFVPTQYSLYTEIIKWSDDKKMLYGRIDLLSSADPPMQAESSYFKIDTDAWGISTSPLSFAEVNGK